MERIEQPLRLEEAQHAVPAGGRPHGDREPGVRGARGEERPSERVDSGLGALAATIHSYPTQAEAIKKLGDLYQRSRLTPRVAAILRTILHWRR